MVSGGDLRAAIERLDLAGDAVMIHVSLRSFPRVEGGAATLVDGFGACGCTLLVPTMANDAFGIPAPPDDRPDRNGIDYAAKDASAARVPWPGMSDIYDPTRTDTDAGIGATPAYVAGRPDRVRCRLSPGSFAAIGPAAEELIAAETPVDTFGPLRALADRGGRVVLMGVGLDRMTILHLAEVVAGRRPFVRWARGPDGRAVRSCGGGCSRGFPRLDAVLAPVERTTVVGASRWRSFPAADAVALAADAIRRDPTITHCGRRSCLECDDAVAGGPA